MVRNRPFFVVDFKLISCLGLPIGATVAIAVVITFTFTFALGVLFTLIVTNCCRHHRKTAHSDQSRTHTDSNVPLRQCSDIPLNENTAYGTGPVDQHEIILQHNDAYGFAASVVAK